MSKKLCSLVVDEDATVVDNSSCGAVRRRLLDMGLIEGTRVKCLFKSPLGDPIAYRVRGTVVALRKEDSAKIFVVKNCCGDT